MRESTPRPDDQWLVMVPDNQQRIHAMFHVEHLSRLVCMTLPRSLEQSRERDASLRNSAVNGKVT